MKMLLKTVVCVALAALVSCKNEVEKPSTRFTEMPADYTGVTFENRLDYDEEYNQYTYRSYWNGGGVAIGDVNNDSLPDVFFCGNRVPSKLYLNRGNFKFEDVTAQAGVGCEGVWVSGATFADINGDGWLDLYVCKSGKPDGSNRHNELFINKGAQAGGKVAFEEKSKAYGIADLGLSVNAAFFDYDRDGDLDCYLLNNSMRPVGNFDLRRELRDVRDTLGGNKLYRNDGEKFTDVSAAAGIYGSNIGFGLGVTVGDINRDGLQDMYVSNDFYERDYLYINRGDGTFSEELEQRLRETSMGAMGADMADLDNDGMPEVFVTEMTPQHEDRLKTKAKFDDWNKFQQFVRGGFFYQFPRNTLQWNRGDGTFSEIGRWAGVHATDWSWGALMADFDNDGRKDIFVANGIYKDLLDQDYLNFFGSAENVQKLKRSGSRKVMTTLSDSMPTEAVANYLFQQSAPTSGENIGTFTDRATEWGLGKPSFSNGSAYADLDNDGDLDLVVNNVNMPPFVYRNNTQQQEPTRHWLRLSFEGYAQNTFGLGVQVTLRKGGQQWYQELAPMRGFQSTVDCRLLFGLGEVSTLDTVEVRWPDGNMQYLTQVATNRELRIRYADAKHATEQKRAPVDAIFTEIRWDTVPTHRENMFSDFDRDRLLFHMRSTEGPKVAVADVNKDGLEDFYLCGAKDASGQLWLQRPDGRFVPSLQPAFADDRYTEDVQAVFFDADSDGDPDLYVASGGSEYLAGSPRLLDRLYLNTNGNFAKKADALPPKPAATGCIAVGDYNRDGRPDLFVGLRTATEGYGLPAPGYILQNSGNATFRDVTAQVAPDISNIGLFTAAQWLDSDGNGSLDLLLAGEWMAPTLLLNQGGKFATKTILKDGEGWWYSLAVADLDHDGDTDIVIGGHGENTRFRCSPETPVRLHFNDYDKNKTPDPIITCFNGEKDYPMALRHDLMAHMPWLKKKYLYYKSYKLQTWEDIFTGAQRDGTRSLSIKTQQSRILLNDGKGNFTTQSLPVQAQFAPVYAILVRDFDGDNHLDILMGGNLDAAKPEVGQYEASYGLLLRGDGKGRFAYVPATQSGLRIRGDIRDLVPVRIAGREQILVARNNAGVVRLSF